MIYGVLLVLAFLLWVIAIIDILNIAAPGKDKIIWLLVILFLPIIGTLLYFVVQRPKWEDR